MKIEITPQQLTTWNAQRHEQQKRAYLQQAHATWNSHFARLMPATQALPDPAVQRYLDQGYELCINNGILEKPVILEFIFTVLRAAHLGCSATFIQEMCQYFIHHPSSHALEWMDYVLSGHFQQDLISEAKP